MERIQSEIRSNIVGDKYIAIKILESWYPLWEVKQIIEDLRFVSVYSEGVYIEDLSLGNALLELEVAAMQFSKGTCMEGYEYNDFRDRLNDVCKEYRYL